MHIRFDLHSFTYLGQFWNIPVSIEQYFGPIKGGYAGMNVTYHLITVTQATSTRTFLGELFDIPWDRRSGTYAANVHLTILFHFVYSFICI